MSKKPMLEMLFAMTVFGTVGVLVHAVPEEISRGFIAFVRAAVAFLFLLILLAVKNKKISFEALKRHPLLLPASGAAMGANWVLMFEAYKYSVGKATLCYYFAPIIVILLSPVFFGEKLTGMKILCTVSAFSGMILVSGVVNEGFDASELTGVFLALGAAVLYASVMLINKAINDIKTDEKTFFQMGCAAVVLLLYTLVFEGLPSASSFDFKSVVILLTLGVLHTGIGYTCWFSAFSKLKAQTAALLGYIDPVVTVILSALLLGENPGVFGYIGAVLILGAAAVSSIEKTPPAVK